MQAACAGGARPTEEHVRSAFKLLDDQFDAGRKGYAGNRDGREMGFAAA